MARVARRERSRAEQRLSIGRFAQKFVTWHGGGVIFFFSTAFLFHAAHRAGPAEYETALPGRDARTGREIRPRKVPRDLPRL